MSGLCGWNRHRVIFFMRVNKCLSPQRRSLHARHLNHGVQQAFEHFQNLFSCSVEGSSLIPVFPKTVKIVVKNEVVEPIELKIPNILQSLIKRRLSIEYSLGSSLGYFRRSTYCNKGLILLHWSLLFFYTAQQFQLTLDIVKGRARHH